MIAVNDLFNPLSPNGDQCPISRSNIMTQSNIQVRRIKEMITKDKFIDMQTSSHKFYHNKHMESSQDNVQVDLKVSQTVQG